MYQGLRHQSMLRSNGSTHENGGACPTATTDARSRCKFSTDQSQCRWPETFVRLTAQLCQRLGPGLSQVRETSLCEAQDGSSLACVDNPSRKLRVGWKFKFIALFNYSTTCSIRWIINWHSRAMALARVPPLVGQVRRRITVIPLQRRWKRIRRRNVCPTSKWTIDRSFFVPLLAFNLFSKTSFHDADICTHILLILPTSIASRVVKRLAQTRPTIGNILKRNPFSEFGVRGVDVIFFSFSVEVVVSWLIGISISMISVLVVEIQLKNAND